MESMTCGEFREEMAAHAAGWLDDAARQRWEAHRDACPACAAEAARDARLVRLLASVPAVEPERVSWAGVMDVRGRSRRRWAPALAGAAAIVALVAGSYRFWPGEDVAPVVGSDTAAYVSAHVQLSTVNGTADPNTMVLLSAVREGNG